MGAGEYFGYGSWVQSLNSKKEKTGPPSVSVTVTSANAETWKIGLQAIGTLRVVPGIDVTSELSGIVTELQFQSGDEVKTGDLLVELNITPKLNQIHFLANDSRLSWKGKSVFVFGIGFQKHDRST